MFNTKKRVFTIIVGIIILVILSFLARKLYIHNKYFTLEQERYEITSDLYSYNSPSYGYVNDDFYILHWNDEIIRFTPDDTPYAFSKHGEIVFNHIGQLFLRDIDKVYEVTDTSVDFIFESDSLNFAQRIGSKVYYVRYIYDEEYSELYVYDDELKESKYISKVMVNDYRRRFYDDIGFAVEGDWLVFVHGENESMLGLYNLTSGKLTNIISRDSFEEDTIEYIILSDGRIYFKTVTYDDIPRYGVDDIGGTGGEVDYCYDISLGKLYNGKLDKRIEWIRNEDFKDKSEIHYVKNLSDNEVNSLFGYIDDPKLIEPEGDLYDYDLLKNSVFSFEIDNDIDVYYSFNHPNVMKYGKKYEGPFQLPVDDNRYNTVIYYYAIHKETGMTSRVWYEFFPTY